jgi:hypothetical protein
MPTPADEKDEHTLNEVSTETILSPNSKLIDTQEVYRYNTYFRNPSPYVSTSTFAPDWTPGGTETSSSTAEETGHSHFNFSTPSREGI